MVSEIKTQKRELSGDTYAETVQLVERAKSGERAALSQLCESIARGVLYRVRFGLDNFPDAEDVAQEVLVRVCQKIHELRNPQAFKAWLAKIIINETNTFRAKNYKQKNVLNIDDYTDTFFEERESFLPSEDMEDREARKTVIDAVLMLPSKQRQAVLFYYYDGLSVKQIAEVMEVESNSVYTHLARARDKIKELLERTSLYCKPKNADMMSLGSLLGGAFESDALNFTVSNADWMSNAMVKCQAVIAEGLAVGVATATVATAATATATTATAATTTATTATAAGATAATATVSASTIATVSACVIALSALCIGAVHVVYGEPPTTPPTVQQTQISGRISFAGGEDIGEGTAYINPRQAQLEVGSEAGEVTALHWWIVKNPEGHMVYQGDGSDVSDALDNLNADNERGEFTMHFRATCESGLSHIISRNFYITPN